MTLNTKLGLIPLYAALKLLEGKEQELAQYSKESPLVAVEEYDSKQFTAQDIISLRALPEKNKIRLERRIAEDHLKNPLLLQSVEGSQELTEVVERLYERHAKGITPSTNDFIYLSTLLATNLRNQGIKKYQLLFPTAGLVTGMLGSTITRLDLFYSSIEISLSGLVGLLYYLIIRMKEKFDERYYAKNRIRAAHYITERVKEILTIPQEEVFSLERDMLSSLAKESTQK